MEAALSINLDHPNIVGTFKVVVEDSPSCATSSGASPKELRT